jgi:hypothetical protein
MPQPPYSPDMAPCDFLLFPKMKKTLKGCCFTSKLNELKAIPKIEFEKCFKDWRKHWHKWIVSNRDYFEDDELTLM